MGRIAPTGMDASLGASLQVELLRLGKLRRLGAVPPLGDALARILLGL